MRMVPEVVNFLQRIGGSSSSWWGRLFYESAAEPLDAEYKDSAKARSQKELKASCGWDHLAMTRGRFVSHVALLLWIAWTWLNAASASNIAASELAVLHDLFNATNGNEWQWRPADFEAGNQWVFDGTSDPCADHWQGVVCTNDTYDPDYLHVNSLKLNIYNLVGTIPASIANLTQLTVLDLGTNSLTGTIPASIGAQMGQLSVLIIHRNRLRGTLPSSFEHLSQLRYLDIGGNILTGSFPAVLLRLSTLEVLYLDVNLFKGALPAVVGDMTRLEVLAINTNAFTGTIPSAWGALINLRILTLYRNQLRGALPAALGHMSSLQHLVASENQFNGSIPASLGNLANLTVLDLRLNQLSGKIPAALTTLPRVRLISLFGNDLIGSVPTGFGQCLALQTFDLGVNRLSGTIPQDLSTLPGLHTLLLDNNTFTGLIPGAGVADGTQWPALQRLDLAFNLLSGPLPRALASNPNISALSVSNNHLSGLVPPWLCELQNLTRLDLSNNLFRGPVLPCLNNMSGLLYAVMDNNQLTGPVPAINCTAGASKLQALWLSGNYLTGTLPSISTECKITQAFMSNNYLIGPLPSAFGDPSIMEAVELGQNFFTGTIPRYMGQLARAQIIQLYGNLLTGCLPSFGQSGSTRLVELLVNSNHLSCPLDGVFNASAQPLLSTIDISDNQLRGTLPEEVFALPKLTSFIALTNCFSGTLATEICSSDHVGSLILDGLHSASTCRSLLLPAAHTYDVPTSFHGSIPPCLFGMRLLNTLHLSGNGLIGTIPNLVNDSVGLVDLILSHNALTGTIPTSVQTHNWRTLDLSFNRLGGVLQSDFGSNLASISEVFGNSTYNSSSTTIVLENNRLSGRVPSPLLHLLTISILGSNVFACDLGKTDLPQHDSNRKAYQCGSNAFDVPFFAALFIILGVAAVMAATMRYRNLLMNARTAVTSWLAELSRLPHHTTVVLTGLDVLCKVSIGCTALVLLALLPWYVAAGKLYGTYTYEYAWSVSAAFLSGVTPTAVQLVLFTLMMLALVPLMRAAIRREDRHHQELQRRSSGLSVRSSTATLTPAPQPIPRWQRYLVYAVFLSVNMLVVVGVNAAFVVTALKQSNGVVFLAQLMLSAFKLGWNTVCMPFLIYAVIGYAALSRSSVSFVAVQLMIGLFNNIAIPCLVTAVLSPSCFYSVFDSPNPVDSVFTYRNCLVVPGFIDCDAMSSAIKPLTLRKATYLPPFRYDYQCSSAFITYYAPAFVYLGISAGALAPLAKVAGVWLLSRTRPGSWLDSTLRRLLPTLLQPPREPSSDSLATRRSSSRLSVLSLVTTALPTLTSLWSGYKPLFDANNLLITQVIYLGILLTFGVVFPPLAVVMCATMLSVAWQAKLTLGRYLLAVKEVNPTQLTAIEQACAGAVSLIKLRRSLFIVVVYCCCFYALFLFDTLGDAVGLQRAYWVLIVMPLAPLLLLGFTRCINQQDTSGKAHFGASLGSALELSEMDRYPAGSDNNIHAIHGAAGGQFTFNILRAAVATDIMKDPVGDSAL